ncbi:MAG: hypothetical protein K2N16_10660 [Muribaculaceae bacterium]|nr:hypothetical protein [Muribaculaceae bacterium]
MKRYDDIQQLADRFLDGCTSLAEERELERFFADHKADIASMPEHLQVIAEMFGGFAVAAPAPAKQPAWRRWRWAASAAAAACITAILALALWRADAPETEHTASVTDSTVPPTLLIAFDVPVEYPEETLAPVRPTHRCLRRPSLSVQQPIASEAVAASNEAVPIPMGSDNSLETVMQACELAVLEAKFQTYKTSVTYVKI